ncbi:DUF7003 family protein, partial [Bacillus pacificus]|uniref:DUF7003 family protein n=1 Tax=Bacillus pacificus TaxID=2026187 RepID=UPI003F68B6D0
IGMKMIHMQTDILKLLDRKQSNYEFFQSVAAAIKKKDPTIIVNKDCNTHWNI